MNANELAARARRMTDAVLAYALQDIAETLPLADAMDRENGRDNGGRYRDEATAYRREQARRARVSA